MDDASRNELFESMMKLKLNQIVLNNYVQKADGLMIFAKVMGYKKPLNIFFSGADLSCQRVSCKMLDHGNWVDMIPSLLRDHEKQNPKEFVLFMIDFIDLTF